MAAVNNSNGSGRNTRVQVPQLNNPFFMIPNLASDGDFEALGIVESGIFLPPTKRPVSLPDPAGDSDNNSDDWGLDTDTNDSIYGDDTPTIGSGGDDGGGGGGGYDDDGSNDFGGIGDADANSGGGSSDPDYDLADYDDATPGDGDPNTVKYDSSPGDNDGNDSTPGDGDPNQYTNCDQWTIAQGANAGDVAVWMGLQGAMSMFYDVFPPGDPGLWGQQIAVGALFTLLAWYFEVPVWAAILSGGAAKFLDLKTQWQSGLVTDVQQLRDQLFSILTNAIDSAGTTTSINALQNLYNQNGCLSSGCAEVLSANSPPGTSIVVCDGTSGSGQPSGTIVGNSGNFQAQIKAPSRVFVPTAAIPFQQLNVIGGLQPLIPPRNLS